MTGFFFHSASLTVRPNPLPHRFLEYHGRSSHQRIDLEGSEKLLHAMSNQSGGHAEALGFAKVKLLAWQASLDRFLVRFYMFPDDVYNGLPDISDGGEREQIDSRQTLRQPLRLQGL